MPRSLRIENIGNSKFNKMYEVDFVLSKNVNDKKYNIINYGDKSKLYDYVKDDDVFSKISYSLINNNKQNQIERDKVGQKITKIKVNKELGKF